MHKLIKIDIIMYIKIRNKKINHKHTDHPHTTILYVVKTRKSRYMIDNIIDPQHMKNKRLLFVTSSQEENVTINLLEHQNLQVPFNNSNSTNKMSDSNK